MDAKTILNPKGWLIGVGTVNILFSIMNYAMGGDVATTALDAQYGALSERELAMATGYEEGWGIFGIPYGVLAIASGILLSGSDRAKMALTAGLTFIVTFLALVTVSNANGYEVPMDQAAPLFVVLIALTASGYMHMNDDETESAES
ncbi:MAG: hypothetical protein ACPGJA_00055 [Candidatus Thalassarchaeaceae archaeon]